MTLSVIEIYSGGRGHRDQDAPGLGHRLDDQDARHDRPSRPVPLEERLVGAYILDRHDRLAGLNLEHAVVSKNG